ncbi:MAG: hypothetical protein ABIO79_15450 [Ferruginibacter sp.]
MIKQFKFLKLFALTLLISFAVTGCNTQPKEPRYVVLSNGESPVFLDTKTQEVYVIYVGGDKPVIYKKPLKNTE